MNYNEAIEYIHGTKKFGSKLGTDNIRELLRLMGNPHNKLKHIHIAGTNGKGSTSSFIASILQSAGYKAGLFTSPYLERFNERIRVNEKDIEDESLAKITAMVKEKVNEMIEKDYNHPTEFEIVTAIAFQYYMEQQVDFVVLEVGLGGRYDSTNVIEDSVVSVITTISMDHMDILGDTISKIAYEKAGIIKENGLTVCYPQEKDAQVVIEDVCKHKKSHLIHVPTENMNITQSTEYGSTFDISFGEKTFKDLEISMLGKHQVFNASTALTAILTLNEKGITNISDEDIRKGLKNIRWAGRLEVLNRKPTFLIDGAHNAQGIESLKKSLREIFNYDNIILGVGMLMDKDVDTMLSELIPIADKVVVTEPNIFRSMKAEDLAKKIDKYNKEYVVASSIEDSIDKAFDMANDNDLIVFAGSLYLIGDVRRIVMNK